MNKEILMIISMTLGGALFSIGGTGFKPARRFILPFVLAVVALLAGHIWWRCLIVWLGTMVAFHLPYGEKTPYWGKFLVGCAFIAPTAALGFSLWQLITPVAFILMFMASNTKGLSAVFKWKVVEFLTGSLIGITVATIL